MARKRYTAKQLTEYLDDYLWCRSFGHAWEFVKDKVGRRGNTLTIYEVVECSHCGMVRHDWRESTKLVRRRYETPDEYYIGGVGEGRSPQEVFQGERIKRKIARKVRAKRRVA